MELTFRANSSTLHRAILKAGDVTPLQLKERKLLRYHIPEEDKVINWME